MRVFKASFFLFAASAASLICGESEAAVLASVSIDSPSALTITLNGTLDGNAPPRFPREVTIDFGTANYSSDAVSPISFSGGFNVSTAAGLLFNNANSAFDSIQLFAVPINPLPVGTLVSGQASFEYGIAHQIELGQDFSVWWGASNPSVGGMLQSTGRTVVIPEPVSASLATLSVLAVFKRRR